MSTKNEILTILDKCAESFNFPMLDNGYVYLGVTRMSLFRSNRDWAIVIEVFGYSPRSGVPDTQIYTFSNKLYNRDPESNYVTQEAYKNYLKNNPYNESRFIYPIDNEDWLDEENPEKVKSNSVISIRGELIEIFPIELYKENGIELEGNTPWVFELTRLLSKIKKESILALDNERKVSVPPELDNLMILDEWHHPDLISGELPSGNETFQQLAEVLETGDISRYKPSMKPNTRWENWPEGGLL